MNISPRFVTLLTTVLALGSAAAIAAPLAHPVNEDEWGLAAYYREFEVVPMDPVTTLAELEDGRIHLELYGESYDILASPAPWTQATRLGRLQVDHTVVYESLAFAPSAFVGVVEGVEGSRVLFSITESGVAGFVAVGDDKIAFSPVRSQTDAAPPGLSVVYPSFAAIAPDVPHVEVEMVPDATVGAAAPATDSGLPQSSHAPGPDRTLLMFADSDMVNSNAAWATRMFNAYNAVDAAYVSMAGFSFNLAGGSVYYCADDACDASWGMNNVDGGALLTAWGNNMRDYAPASFEQAAFTTGHGITNAQGVAWQPGRYSATDAVGISDDYYAKVLAHEIGHGYNGDHGRWSSFPGRAQQWTHDHGSNHVHVTNHCHTYLPLTSLCLVNHEHQENHWHAVNYNHFEIMNYVGSNWNDEWVYQFGSDNYYWVRSCNFNSWTEGTFTSSGATTTWGYYCKN